jgi:EmrB/QacA subfamily drug resistance transporter
MDDVKPGSSAAARNAVPPLGREQKLVVAIAVLASFVSFLDGTVVNVALPRIIQELGGGLAAQQWIVDAYLVTLGAFILVAGSVSDLYGRILIMRIGLIAFGLASLAVGFAPTVEFLIGARAVQGIAGALLVPSSLALITANIRGAAQGRAIGLWTGMTSVAMIAGPVIGGVFVDFLNIGPFSGWRFAFVLNVIPIGIVLWLLVVLGHQNSRKEGVRVDYLGAALCTVGLAGIVFALIEQQNLGWGSPAIWGSMTIGVLAFAGFLVRQRFAHDPIMPLVLFQARNFWTGNVATALIYGALSLSAFAIGVYLQEGPKLPATLAGIASLPSTVIMILFSSRVGSWAGRFGPRMFMTIGPIVCGVGVLTMLMVMRDFDYWWQMLPGIVIFGVGLTLTVSPLTSAILGAIEPERSGIASAVNNAVSRVAGLIVTALLGVITGGALNLDGFHRTIVVMAALLVAGGLVSFAGIRNHLSRGNERSAVGRPADAEPEAAAPGAG